MLARLCRGRRDYRHHVRSGHNSHPLMFRANRNNLIYFAVLNQNGQTAITHGSQVMISNIEPTTSARIPANSMGSIETLTTKYAKARQALGDAVQELNNKIEALKRQHLSHLKSLVADAADAHATLSHAVQSSPGLFEKPKTQTFAGIKVGFRKGTGGIDWDDDDKVVALIEKHFPKSQAELLIKTTKKPIAKALADLDVADLKRIGCRVEATGEVVFIKPTDSAVDKIVNALLKEATESEGAA